MKLMLKPSEQLYVFNKQRKDLRSLMLYEQLTPDDYTWARTEYIRLGVTMLRMLPVSAVVTRERIYTENMAILPAL